MSLKLPENFWGYAAGIIAGVTYGLNPLFAKPLMNDGVSVDTILLFRYSLAVLMLGAWILFHRDSFRISLKQFSRLAILGLLFGCSSLFLFMSYDYIPAGLATTLVYLYPVLVALIMVFLKIYPTWQVWLSIILTLVGVVILCRPSGGQTFRVQGVLLAGGSALVYAMYLVIVNRSTAIRSISNNLLTFYALLVGTVIFFAHHLFVGGDITENLGGIPCWINLFCLAFFPTIVSLVALAVSTRLIGATKTSVLGVFEPITAILVGSLVFGEPLTTNVMVGVTISITAIIFMIVTAKQKRSSN